MIGGTVLLLAVVIVLAAPSAALKALPTVVLDGKCNEATSTCEIPAKNTANYIFRCTGDATLETSVYWLLGDYQTVDPQEFENDGIEFVFTDTPEPDPLKNIPNTFSMTQMNISADKGVGRLFDFFGIDSFNISCISVMNEINIVGQLSYLMVKENVTVIFEVTGPQYGPRNCTDNGTVEVDISFMRAAGVDTCSNYSLSLSGDGNSCGAVVEDGLNLRFRCDIRESTSVVTATLFCGPLSKEYQLTEINCCTGDCEGNFSCSCGDAASAAGWSCNITDTTELRVVDIFGGIRRYGQTFPLNNTCNVTVAIPPTPEREDDPTGLIVVVVICFIVSLVVGVILPLLIYWLYNYCAGQGKK